MVCNYFPHFIIVRISMKIRELGLFWIIKQIVPVYSPVVYHTPISRSDTQPNKTNSDFRSSSGLHL